MTKIFIPELNIWNNRILSDIFNVNKKFLKKSAVAETNYINYINLNSLQEVLFSKTYNYETFNIFYKNVDLLHKSSRMYLYSNIDNYVLDELANTNIEIPIDSTGKISTEIIPNELSLPKEDESTNISYNIFKITFEEYYFLNLVKKYKSGTYDSTSLIDYNVQSNLSHLLYTYLDCEINSKYPQNSIMSSDDSRIIEFLYSQWTVNYLYLKKQICDIQIDEEKETHFYTPESISKIIILTNNDISNNFIKLNNSPPNINYTKLFYKNRLITGNEIQTYENNTFDFYWNNNIQNELKPNDKFYLIWSYIPQELTMVI